MLTFTEFKHPSKNGQLHLFTNLFGRLNSSVKELSHKSYSYCTYKTYQYSKRDIAWGIGHKRGFRNRSMIYNLNTARLYAPADIGLLKTLKQGLVDRLTGL